MLFGLQVFNDLTVDFDILESSVKDDEDLGSDGPIVEVGNVALKDELQRAQSTHMVFVFTVHALEHVDDVLFLGLLWVEMESRFD